MLRCHNLTDSIVRLSQMSKTEAPKASAKIANPGRKLFIGPRFRRLRRQLGLSQTQMAEEIGISASYVNLIERNQRPVTCW